MRTSGGGDTAVAFDGRFIAGTTSSVDSLMTPNASITSAALTNWAILGYRNCFTVPMTTEIENT